MLAFCFLVYDKVEHHTLWETFFAQDLKNRHSIISHPKTITENTQLWIKNNAVEPVNTDWCSEGLINAFNVMLRKGLKNKKNKYFCLVSGSCIPLYPFEETFKKITSSDKARIPYEKAVDVFEDDNYGLYKSHQWVILNRKIARDMIRLSDPKDKKAQKFLNRMRESYLKNGVKTGDFKAVVDGEGWLGGCPDETYPINWIIDLYGIDGMKKLVKKQLTTYTQWNYRIDPDHPRIFDIKSVKRYKKEICGTGHIFARKFTPDAANWISQCCGINKPNYIRKELVGRLGNQMFQWASMLGIAKMKGGEACIKKSTIYDEDRKVKDDMVNVFDGPFRTCRKKVEFKTVKEPHWSKYDISPFLKYSNIEIKTTMDTGFLQSWKYFENIKDEIKNVFTFKIDIAKKAQKIIKKVSGEKKHVVGIHIRRGDHISLGYLRFPTMKYFTTAMDYFIKKYNGNVSFIIATNDKKWVEKNFNYDSVIILKDNTPAEDMAVLSLCDDMIMSIGSFSWWAGYLNKGEVIYYKNEIVKNHKINKGFSKGDYY